MKTLQELQDALYYLRNEYEEKSGEDIGEALVWIQMERGIDGISRIEIKNGVVDIWPEGQDSA